MKIITLATVVAFSASTAFAGNMNTEAMDPPAVVDMVEEPAGSGALGWIIPLVVVAAIALASDD